MTRIAIVFQIRRCCRRWPKYFRRADMRLFCNNLVFPIFSSVTIFESVMSYKPLQWVNSVIIERRYCALFWICSLRSGVFVYVRQSGFVYVMQRVFVRFLFCAESCGFVSVRMKNMSDSSHKTPISVIHRSSCAVVQEFAFAFEFDGWRDNYADESVAFIISERQVHSVNSGKLLGQFLFVTVPVSMCISCRRIRVVMETVLWEIISDCKYSQTRRQLRCGVGEIFSSLI